MTRVMRRLTIIAVVCLLVGLWLPWVDDEADRTPGLLLFSGRDSDAGLGWVRITLVITILAALLGAVTAVRRWHDDAIHRVVTWAAPAAVCCGLSAIVGAIATARLGPRAGTGLPTTVVLAAMATAVLGFTAYLHRNAGQDPATGAEGDSTARFTRRHVMATVVVLVVGIILAPLGGRWWVSWRHADASTASGPDSVPAAEGPDRPKTVAWSQEADGVVAAGPYAVLLGDGDGKPNAGEGISVVDAATGEERWHYHRDDGPLDDVVVDVPDNLLVASVELDEGDLYEVVAFDLSTGAQITSVSDGVVGLQKRHTPRVFAWSADDGSQVWSRSLGTRCFENTATTTTLFIAGPGCVERDAAVGYSLRTGKEIWRHTLPSARDITSLDDAVQIGHTVILDAGGWWSTPEEDSPEGGVVALDTTSGKRLWRNLHVHPSGMSRMKDRMLLHGDRIRAFDAHTGRPVWTVSPPAGDPGYGLATDHHDRAYATARTENHIRVRVFDASGTILHTTSIPTCSGVGCSGTHYLSGSATVGGVADQTLLMTSPPYAVLSGEGARVTGLRAETPRADTSSVG